MPNIRLAFRTLFKTPFVTAVAVLSLSLGIGANSAIFSLFDQMLLMPLPVAEPDRLVNLSAPGPKPGSNSCSNAGPCEDVISYPMFRDLERVQTSFTGIAGHRNFGASLGYKGTTLGGDGLLVSGSYFPVLGISPAHGRLFTSEDDLVYTLLQAGRRRSQRERVQQDSIERLTKALPGLSRFELPAMVVPELGRAQIEEISRAFG